MLFTVSIYLSTMHNTIIHSGSPPKQMPNALPVPASQAGSFMKEMR